MIFPLNCEYYLSMKENIFKRLAGQVSTILGYEKKDYVRLFKRKGKKSK
jgi:hypothetical protein